MGAEDRRQARLDRLNARQKGKTERKTAKSLADMTAYQAGIDPRESTNQMISTITGQASGLASGLLASQNPLALLSGDKSGFAFTSSKDGTSGVKVNAPEGDIKGISKYLVYALAGLGALILFLTFNKKRR